MWTRYLVAAAALTPLAAAGLGALIAPGDARAESLGGVGCEIRAAPMPGGVRLAGVATARSAIAGSYSFTLAKRGGGGSSTVSQGGDFALGPAGESVLNEVALGLGGGETYRAELTLTWAGGSLSCRKDYPARA